MSQPRFVCDAVPILHERYRRYQRLLEGKTFKKDDLKSTEIPSKKDIKNILGQGLTESGKGLNET